MYTGTYGILYLKKLAGGSTRFYLYTEADSKYISAPLYFWKVIYNPDTHEAMAFVGTEFI